MKWKTFFKIFLRSSIPFRKKRIEFDKFDIQTMLKLGAIPALFIIFNFIYAILMVSLKTQVLKYFTKEDYGAFYLISAHFLNLPFLYFVYKSYLRAKCNKYERKVIELQIIIMPLFTIYKFIKTFIFV
tara:strand:+ start:427 stop:810 length:384 start_codon:yes stop_codon:yes gene_type:complete